MSFRTRLFLASLGAAIATLVVATVLLSWSLRQAVGDRIQRSLAAQARVTAELVSRHRGPMALHPSAKALGDLGQARVTFIGRDGQVLGDSDVGAGELAGIDNHGDRPEVLTALAGTVGTAQRYSETVGSEMVYVAVPVNNPEIPSLAVMRLAMPLTDVHDQVAVVRRVAVAGLLVGLAAAAALAWGTSLMLARRMHGIAETAARYAAGDFSRPTRDLGKDEIGMVARVLDDSVRELGQRAADRALLEAILGGMIEGVLVVNEYGKLQLVNAAARRMLKVAGAPEGRHYLEIVRHPDIAAQLGYALNGRATEGRELKLPLDPGATFVARSAPVMASTGRGAVLVLHDITDLRRADQIRRDFVANVSHELRTPLTAVRGYVEALLDGDVDGEHSRRFLETIARHTLRMERLVRDLLRLARLDAGQELLERVPCSIETLFAGVETELEDSIEIRSLEIAREIDPDATTVRGDPAKLHDALRNLLENAINYSPEGGRISLASRRAGDRLVMTVSDEGPGIPDADLPRIFERFYRADKARSRAARDPGGTGLGLAIVRHLIELHGGKVSAANGKERGAVLSVELPAG